MENRQEELPLSFSVFPERVLVDRWKKFLFYKMGKKKTVQLQNSNSLKCSIISKVL